MSNNSDKYTFIYQEIHMCAHNYVNCPHLGKWYSVQMVTKISEIEGIHSKLTSRI